MTALLNCWMPGMTLLAWSGVLLGSFATGRFTSLHPSFRPFTLAAGVVLLALAGLMLLHPAARAACHDDDPTQPLTRFAFGRWLTFFVLVIPIVAAAWSSPEGFSAATIRNRGVATEATGLPGRPAAADEAGAAGAEAFSQYTPKTPDGAAYKLEVVDLLFAAEEPPLRDWLAGQTVELVGQLLPEETANVTGNRFRLVRMFMSCCAADARPIAISVEGRDKTDAAEMSWVRIRGRATFPVESGKPSAVLIAERISPTTPPEETMLF